MEELKYYVLGKFQNLNTTNIFTKASEVDYCWFLRVQSLPEKPRAVEQAVWCSSEGMFEQQFSPNHVYVYIYRPAFVCIYIYG